MSRQDDSDPALSDPALSDPLPTAEASIGPASGPRYRRRGLLGVGGMGRVVVAWDALLHREVALKEAASPALAERLSREARITAQLEHPGIVAVYDAGLSPEGRPWYCMRLVRGRTLDDALADCAEMEARIALLPRLLSAAQAIAYAHAMGIVHRDIKPANIMVGQFGETMVVDWGLAGPIDAVAEDWQRIAAGANRPAGGTSRYMSPEQAAGAPPGLAADVWSLGVTLDELLGKAEDRPPELLAVARRATRVSPSDRYPSAAEFAAELERWLAGRRVLAHPYGLGERLRRWARARRAPLAVGLVGFVALAVAVGLGLGRAAQDRALAEALLGAALTQQALTALAEDRRPAAELLAAQALALGPSPDARGVLVAVAGPRPEQLEQVALPEACKVRVQPSPDGTLLACAAEGRVELWERAPLRRRWSVKQPVDLGLGFDRGLLVHGAGQLLRLSLQDGGRLEAWATDLPADLWSGAVGTAPGSLLRYGQGGAVTLLPLCLGDRASTAVVGTRVVTACGDGVHIYGLDGQPQRVVPLGASGGWSALAVDGDALLVGTFIGSVEAFDPATGDLRPLLAGFGGAIVQLLGVPGSPYVVALGERGLARIGDRERGAWVGSLPGVLRALGPGPGPGELLALGEDLGRWRLPDDLRPSAIQLGAGLSQVAVSVDGVEVAYALGSGEVGLRRVADGAALQTWRWQDAVAKCVAFVGDGLVASAMDGGWRRLQRDGTVAPATATPTVLRRAGALGQGAWGIGYANPLVVFDETGETTLPGAFFEGSSSPGQQRAVMLADDGGVWLFDGDKLEKIDQQLDLVAADIGDEGRPLVLASRHRLCVDDHCVDLDETVVDVAYDGGGAGRPAGAGALVAVGTLSGLIELRDAESLELLATLHGHSGRVSSVEFGPGWLVSGSWDGSLRFWDPSPLWQDPALLLDTARGWGLKPGVGAPRP